MVIGSCPLDGRLILWSDSAFGVTRHRCSTDSKGLRGPSSCARDEKGVDVFIAHGLDGEKGGGFLHVRAYRG